MSEKRYTVNTGKTDFGMRANSAVREPELQALWREHRDYETLLARSKGSPRFLLHDGPPYASGEIHMGTALNKVLKTFVWNYKSMRGFHVPVALGYDLHGLPIELKVLKKREGRTQGDLGHRTAQQLRQIRVAGERAQAGTRVLFAWVCRSSSSSMRLLPAIRPVRI